MCFGKGLENESADVGSEASLPLGIGVPDFPVPILLELAKADSAFDSNLKLLGSGTGESLKGFPMCLCGARMSSFVQRKGHLQSD